MKNKGKDEEKKERNKAILVVSGHNTTKHTMSFTAFSPARVSVTLDVVNHRSMRSVSPWNFMPQPFGLP